MIVHGPATSDRDGVVERPALQILLRQDVIAPHAAAAAASRHHADPIKRKVGASG